MENKVGAIMSKKVETIGKSDSVYEAAKKMRDKKISSLIVFGAEGGHMGIVTERDIVHRVCAMGVDGKDARVSDIMSSPVATIDLNSTVEAAADLMLSNKVRHLLVVNPDKTPVGIVAPTDLNKYLQGNIDMNEVNARILKAVLDGEEMGEP